MNTSAKLSSVSTRVAVRAAGHHGFGHAEDAAHALDLVKCGDEMHFRCAGVGETGIDAAGEQRAHKAFGAIHGQYPFECEKAVSGRLVFFALQVLLKSGNTWLLGSAADKIVVRVEFDKTLLSLGGI